MAEIHGIAACDAWPTDQEAMTLERMADSPNEQEEQKDCERKRALDQPGEDEEAEPAGNTLAYGKR
jgi:hypothetical protein